MNTDRRILNFVISALLLLLVAAPSVLAAQRTLEGDEASGYYVTLPGYGTDTLLIPAGITSFKLYDDGGPDGKASGYGTIVLKSLDESENSVLMVTGIMKKPNNDLLEIYDGESSNARTIFSRYGTPHGTAIDIGYVLGSGKSLTVYSQNIQSIFDGFDFTVSLVDPTVAFEIENEAVDGGTVTCSKESSVSGETITLEINADDGFLLKSIEVVDETGYHVPLNGRWHLRTQSTLTFTMPYAKVQVIPVFTDDLTAEGGLYLDMQVSGTETVDIPAGVTSFKVYDNGGGSANPSAGGDSKLILNALNVPDGRVLRVSGSIYTDDSGKLFVLDGDAEGDVMFEGSSYMSTIGYVTSTGKTMTLNTKLGTYSFYYFGVNLTVEVVDGAVEHTIENEPVDGGTVTCTKETSLQGETITLQIAAEEGFLLKSIEVIDESNYHLHLEGEWRLREQSTLTFAMPYSDVRIVPTFTDDLTASGGLYINMPASGTKAVVVPAGVSSFKVYDDGGPNGERSKGAGEIVFTAPDMPDNYMYEVVGRLITEDSYSSRDELSIYNGYTKDGNVLLNRFWKNGSIGKVLCTGRIMSMTYNANAPFTNEGLELTISFVDPAATHTVTAEAATGGSVSIRTVEAPKGETITFDVTHEEGYLLSGVDVVDDEGNHLSVSGERDLIDNPVLSFVMPYSNVKIYPTFGDDLTAASLSVNMPASGTKTIDVSAGVQSLKLYDNGGANGYPSYGNATLVLNSLKESDDYAWMVSGTIHGYDSDSLIIYNGADLSGSRVLNVGGQISYFSGYSTGKTIAIDVKSSSYNNFDLTLSLVDISVLHSVTIESEGNGTVTPSKEQAALRDVVTLDIAAEDGSLLKSIDIYDESGNRIAVVGEWQLQKNAMVTFTMPYSNVRVVPVFTDDLTAEGGLYVNMPTTGTKTVNVPAGVTSFKVYDDGGKDGSYTSGSDGILVLSAPNLAEGNVFTVMGSININSYDTVSLYDGKNSTSAKLADFVDTYGSIGERLFTSGSALTFAMKSQMNYGTSGLNLTVSIVDLNIEHAVNVSAVTGGRVTSSKQSYKKDEIVTLDLVADEGYMLNGITLVDGDGKTWNFAGPEYFMRTSSSITFVMPYSDVNITAGFVGEFTAEAGLHIDMGESGRETYSIPSDVKSFKLYDAGGASGTCIGTVDTLTLIAAAGNVFNVSGSIRFDYYEGTKILKIFDGYAEDRVLLDMNGQNYSFNGMYTSGNVLSLVMELNMGVSGECYHSDFDLTVAVENVSDFHKVVIESAIGGSVASDKTSVLKGDVVNLSISPANGMLIDNILVTDENQNTVASYAWYAGNKASFTMPSSNVTVTPSFAGDMTGLSINMPTSGTVAAYIPEGVSSFKLYDDGGPSYIYGNYLDANLVIIAPEGKTLQVYGNMDAAYSYLYFYDGNLLGREIYQAYDYHGSIGTHVSASNVIAVRFKTGYNSTSIYYNYYGLDLTVEVVDPAESHDIHIAEATRGTMVSDKLKARPGEIVTLTGRPDKDGSVLAGVQVVNAAQVSAAVTRTSDTTYTFEMPAMDVAVTPSFANPAVVSFDENGCLNNGTYFHLKSPYDPSHTGSYWLLSQGPVEYPEVGTRDFTCWKDVYDSLEHDRYSKEYKIVLESDLDFGGYDEENSKCAMAFIPVGNSHSEIDGAGHSIKNFCHDSSFAGFVTKDYGGIIQNLVFENAYVRGDTAGVVAATFAGSLYNVTVRNSKVTGVYAGGIAGIVKSNVGGGFVSGTEIASPANCTGAECNAYLGGIAGLMQIDDATIQDARVQDVNFKRTDASYDVYAGGIVGNIVLNYDMGRTIGVARDTVTGISFASCDYAGGLFGKMTLNPIQWTGITASVSDAYVQGSVTALSYAGGLVGLVSEGTLANSMSFGIAKSSVQADISVTGANSYAGGLLGYFENMDSDSNIVVTIRDNSTIGDVTGTQTSTLGYLIGGVSDSSKFKFASVHNNFHFGTNDAQASKGIGTFSDAGWRSPELGENVSANFRNAVNGLNADGTLAYDEHPVKSQVASYYNGVVSASDMMSPKFAATLNRSEYDGGTPLWSFAGSDKNSGLPFIAGGNYRAIYAVGFDKESLERLAGTDKKQILEEALSAKTYAEESCGDGCSAIMLYTNYTGRLEEGDVTFMQNLLDGNAYWSGAQELGSMTVYANAPAPYVYEKSVELNVVYHICTGTISNNVCVDGTEYEIKDGLDIEGYENIGFLLSPVKKFVSDDYRIAIPPMFWRADSSSLGILVPSAYRINSKSGDAGPAVGATSAELFRDLFAEIAEYDFESFSDTVHLVYDMNGENSKDALLFASRGSYDVLCLGYSVAGSWGVDFASFGLYFPAPQNYDDPAPMYAEGMSPLAAGFKVAVDAIPGYSDKYTVEFGLKDFDGDPDTLTVSKDYIVTVDELVDKYRSTVWRKENLTASDAVRMDSIYTGLKVFALSPDDFVMNIVPQYNEYVVTFDVRLPVGVDTTSVFFGQGWDSEKPLTRTQHLKDSLPQLYLAWYVNCLNHVGWGLTGQDTIEGYISSNEFFDGMLSPEHIPENVAAGGKFSLVPIFESPYCAEGYGQAKMYFYAMKTSEAWGSEISYDVHDIHGTVVLSQKVAGTVYEHPFVVKNDTSVLDVPPLYMFTDSDYLEFNVSVRPDPGYEMRNLGYRNYYNGDYPEYFEGVKLGLQIDGTDSILRVGPDDIGSVALFASFDPKTYTVSFKFEPLKNGMVMFGSGWESGTAQLDVVEKSNFPKAYFLADDGLSVVRWSADTLGSRSFNYFNTDLIGDALGGKADEGRLTFHAAASPGTGRTYGTRDLYVKAVNDKNAVLTGYSDHHGSVVLSQSFDTLVFRQESEFTLMGPDEYAYRLTVPDASMDDTLTFDVSVKPDPGYDMSIVSFSDGWNGKPSSGNFGYNAKSKTLKYVPSKMAAGEGFKVKYTPLDYSLVFTRPTVVPPMNGSDTVAYFVAESIYKDKWSDSARSYNLESENRQTPKLYAVNGCIGWSKSRKADSVFYEFDNVAAATLNYVDTVSATYHEVDHETCSEVLSKTITVHADKYGTLELWQFIGKGANVDTVRHTFTPDKGASSRTDKVYTLDVPYYDVGTEDTISMKFEIHGASATPGKYYIDSEESYYYSKTEGGAEVIEFAEGSELTTDGRELEFHLKFKLAEATLAFDAGTDSLFYGNDWKEDGLFALVDSSSRVLPNIVYSNDRCLAGWSLDSAGGDVFTALNVALLDSVYKRDATEGTVLMYPRWTGEVSECAGDFVKLPIEQENGTVSFLENGMRHEFVDGSMLLPSGLSMNALRIKSTPDSSYVLDSLVVLFGREIYEEYGYDVYGSGESSAGRLVLFEGDTLPENLAWASFVAYFGKANKTPVTFVQKNYRQSGHAISLDFVASDFEVTRAVKGIAKVYDGEDNVVSTISLGDSLESGYRTPLVLRMEGPGDYRAVVTLYDAKDTAVYEQEFTVDSTVSPVASESWQMMSLAAADTSAFAWDGDQVFYWWDAGNTGEFWQYKPFERGESIEATRGFWYNSIEGRTLALRSDFKDNDDDVVWNLKSDFDGWNLVANPHSWGIDLYSLNEDFRKDADEEAEVTFLRYDAQTSGYLPTDYLEPFGAVWVQVSKPRKWKISSVPAFARDTAGVDSLDAESPAAKRILAKAYTRERWTIQLTLSDNSGKRDSWNLLGAGPHPHVADEPPASMGDHVNLSIVEGNRLLAKSIRAMQGEMEWAVALSATSDRMGYLTLEGVDGVRAFGYHVYVTVDGETTEVHEGSPLKVYLKSDATHATVRVAPAPRIVAKNTIANLHSLRVGNRLQVDFDASEGLAGTAARVDLLDMKGRVVVTSTVSAARGSNSVLLDAPKTGLYILRVRAGSVSQVGKVWVR